MAKSKAELTHTCGECAHANEVWEHWNRALDGHYICIRCPYCSRSRLKQEEACIEHFKPKAE